MRKKQGYGAGGIERPKLHSRGFSLKIYQEQILGGGKCLIHAFEKFGEFLGIIAKGSLAVFHC